MSQDAALLQRIENLERRLRRTRGAALSFALAFPILLLTAFQSLRSQRERFTEIDVERINLIENDGTLRMVLANNDRSPARAMHGRTFGQIGGRPGMIFYNDEGGEAGGLVFRGRNQGKGTEAWASLTFDQFNQDQVVALQYVSENGEQLQGLTVLDRPEPALDVILDRRAEIRAMPDGPEKEQAQREWLAMQDGVAFGAPRLFVGRDEEASAVVRLSDRRGRVRLRLAVDSAGSGRIEFLDESGAVVNRFPEEPSEDSGRTQ